jgi:hypothetical protein
MSIYKIRWAVLAAGAASLWAQSAAPRDAWMMKNYHFTGPPAPGSIQPVDPVVSELRQIQNTVLSIMRKTDFGEDYEGALAAAAQAAANAQLIGVITERLQAPPPAPILAEEAKPNPPAPIYYLAFKDRTVESVAAYWTDGQMLHYMTPQGSHVQIRLGLVDRPLSNRLNRMRNVEFSLPE